MGAFLRQITAIGALWALCELLLPSDGLRRPARLTVSLLVSALMLSALGDLTASDWTLRASEVLETVSADASVEAEKSYLEHALRAQAHQLESRCERIACKAGYDARAAVQLTPDGALDQIRVRLAPNASGAMVGADALCALLARTLAIDPAQIVAEADGA